MGTDLLPQWGLRPVQLNDQAVLGPYLNAIPQPLSDYTFSQLFSWSNSLRILWTRLEGHLGVFANGSGDLTLLMPPIGDTGSDRALNACFDLMRAYNTAAGCPEQSRVEYVSEALLSRFDCSRYSVEPQGCDYLYDVQRMIDLHGGDLAAKRQLKNRFMRHYDWRIETYDPARHLQPCMHLLDEWKHHQDEHRAGDGSTSATKRARESIACRTSLLNATQLGYRGIVVYVRPRPQTFNDDASRWDDYALRAFTFGELLGDDQASVVIEKTDLEVRGLAQFIFSEFCARCFADRPFINAGDDWGLESLAWTKQSYRPARLLRKYVLRPVSRTVVAVAPSAEVQPMRATVRLATPADLPALHRLEERCFETYRLKKRQLHHLLTTPTAICLVVEQDGKVVAEGIALLRHHKRGCSGRIYSLAVDPSCRGQGLARRVLAELLSRLAEHGVQRTYLQVQQDNETAIRIYRTSGFRDIGILPGYYGAGRDGLHMMHEMPRIAAVQPADALPATAPT